MASTQAGWLDLDVSKWPIAQARIFGLLTPTDPTAPTGRWTGEVEIQRETYCPLTHIPETVAGITHRGYVVEHKSCNCGLNLYRLRVARA